MAYAIHTPTAHGTGLEQSAAMITAKSDRASVVDSADDLSMIVGILGCAVAELARLVPTPTADLTATGVQVVEQRAGMFSAKSNGSDAVGKNVNDLSGPMGIQGGATAESELASAILAPTAYDTGIEHRAAMITAKSDSAGAYV